MNNESLITQKSHFKDKILNRYKVILHTLTN